MTKPTIRGFDGLQKCPKIKKIEETCTIGFFFNFLHAFLSFSVRIFWRKLLRNKIRNFKNIKIQEFSLWKKKQMEIGKIKIPENLNTNKTNKIFLTVFPKIFMSTFNFLNENWKRIYYKNKPNFARKIFENFIPISTNFPPKNLV